MCKQKFFSYPIVFRLGCMALIATLATSVQAQGGGHKGRSNGQHPSGSQKFSTQGKFAGAQSLNSGAFSSRTPTAMKQPGWQGIPKSVASGSFSGQINKGLGPKGTGGLGSGLAQLPTTKIPNGQIQSSIGSKGRTMSPQSLPTSVAGLATTTKPWKPSSIPPVVCGKPGSGSGSGPAHPWKKLQQIYCHQPHINVVNLCHQVRCNPARHWTYTQWCGYYPTTCHWWYSWCGPNWYFDPSCSVSYAWYYYPVTTVSGPQYSWHLGMNCVFIPGKGLGVQEVEAGSPAAGAGIQPGMVIVSANGADLSVEGAMQSVVASSGGRLELTVVSDADGQVTTIPVQMTQVAVTGF